MTVRPVSLSLVAGAAALLLGGCGGHQASIAAERDLGPVSTKILGGAGDSRYLHVFSASISTATPGHPRLSATMLYVGPGSDTLVHVITPLGNATLTQSLQDDSAVPLTVALHGKAGASYPAGSTVPLTVELADHGSLRLSVPVITS